MPAPTLRAPARSVVLALLLFSTVLAPAEARAEHPSVLRIEWPSVPGCPTTNTVAALAAQAMAGAKEVDRVLARVDVTQATLGEPWRVRIRTRTIRGSGERRLEAKTCYELARATALLVALAALRTADRQLATDLEELMPNANRVEEPPLLIERPLRLVGRSEPPLAMPPGDGGLFVASAGIFADSGVLPRLAVGPSVRLDWVLGPYRARVSFVLSLEQERVQRGLGASFEMFGASFDFCRSAMLERVRPYVCIGGEIDQLNGTGIGGQRFEVQRTTGFVFGGLGVEWAPAPSLRVGFDLRTGPSLRRPSFVVELATGERRELHEQSAVRGQALATFGLEF